jgi:two-component sensor histidine kinase
MEDLGMSDLEKVKILLIDDQPAKLMAYQAILEGLGETLLQAANATDAFEVLLKHDVALILLDVCMPDLDGFELARMIRDHPRFRETAIIFVSAINLTEGDNIRAYQLGAIDYVSVPVVPEILCSKVRVFVDLYRKTRALKRLNRELEQRVADRTLELNLAIDRQILLTQEVDHRAKNAYAVIQSIIHLTKRDSPQAFAEALLGRIAAMAHVHSQLSQTRWEGADLVRLLQEELVPYHATAAVRLDGPPIQLEPTAAQSLAIVVHELITNAAKYGALSTREGRVTASWSLSPEELTFEWRESGGPPVVPPTHAGFGTNAINMSIESYLAGTIRVNWLAEGFSCKFAVPSRHVRDKSLPVTEAVIQDPFPLDNVNAFSGQRVLLVEDEPLIGMMMNGMLTDFGLEVTGPIGSFEDALSVAEERFDAAVLDINVGGQLIYPVADILQRNGAHVILVTGYEGSGIDPLFRNSAVLPKPVDPDALHNLLCKGLNVGQ